MVVAAASRSRRPVHGTRRDARAGRPARRRRPGWSGRCGRPPARRPRSAPSVLLRPMLERSGRLLHREQQHRPRSRRRLDGCGRAAVAPVSSAGLRPPRLAALPLGTRFVPGYQLDDVADAPASFIEVEQVPGHFLRGPSPARPSWSTSLPHRPPPLSFTLVRPPIMHALETASTEKIPWSPKERTVLNTNGHQGVLDVTQWTQKKLWSQSKKCPNRRSGAAAEAASRPCRRVDARRRHRAASTHPTNAEASHEYRPLQSTTIH